MTRARRIIARITAFQKGINTNEPEAALKLFVVAEPDDCGARSAGRRRPAAALIEFAVMEALFHRGDMPPGSTKRIS